MKSRHIFVNQGFTRSRRLKVLKKFIFQFSPQKRTILSSNSIFNVEPYVCEFFIIYKDLSGKNASSCSN